MHFTTTCSTILFLVASMMVAPASSDSNLITSNIVDPALLKAEQQRIRQKELENPWFTENGISRNSVQLINAITFSDEHGLDPKSYLIESILEKLETFTEISKASGSFLDSANADQRQVLEDYFYQAFDMLSQDLGSGVLNAKTTQPGLYRERPKVDTRVNYLRLITGKVNVEDIFAELTPATPHYKKLVSHMRQLLTARNSLISRTPVKYIKEFSGDKEHLDVIYLRKRLIETGDLEDKLTANLKYDEPVEKAVMAFQERHGLKATGELTKATVNALNASIDSDIKEIAMNLERWRWMPRELGERHILINIPAYNLSMMNGEQQILDMDVIVGSTKHQTPVFSEDASIVEVSPSWWVPPSITNSELIPLELSKPGYLDSKNMDYWKNVNGKLVAVPRSQVTDADYYIKPFPYMIRQKPGKDNVLGRMKILMPNKYAIYMHDTQDKTLFAKTDRAFSHGCIRLSDPQRVGQLLLELDGMTTKEASATMAETETKRVKLKKKVPTHIGYFTAWIDEDGKLNKRKDVYKHNPRILAGLTKSGTLLSTLTPRFAENASDTTKTVAALE